MKYRVPRIPAAPGEETWVTNLDGVSVMRIETVPHGRSFAVILEDPERCALARVYPRRKLTGTAADVEVGGKPFARLVFRGSAKTGSVHVDAREHTGEYVIAGDFEAWDFHVLLNTSPVADVTARKTGDSAYLVETSDNEPQAPLLAMVLAVDLLVRPAQ